MCWEVVLLVNLDPVDTNSTPMAPADDPQRLLAEWVFSRGGTVFVGPADLETDEKAIHRRIFNILADSLHLLLLSRKSRFTDAETSETMISTD